MLCSTLQKQASAYHTSKQRVSIDAKTHEEEITPNR